MRVKLKKETGKTSAVIHVGNKGYELDIYNWTVIPDEVYELVAKHKDIYELERDMPVELTGEMTCPTCGKHYKQIQRHKCDGGSD